MARVSNWKVVSLLVILLVALLSARLLGDSGYTIMGSIKSLEKQGYNVTFKCENGKVRLSFLTDDLVRIHMTPTGVFPPDDLHLNENGPYAVVRYDWPGAQYKVKEEFDYDLEGTVYKFSTGKIVVKVRKSPFKLAFYDPGGNLLVMEKPGVGNCGLGYADSKVYETMAMADDEHFFGFGAYNNPLDMRGEKMVCYAKELEKHHTSGGFPVPFFLSSRGYGIFFNNLDDDVTFDMGTTEGEYSFGGTSGAKEGWDMDYYFIYGPSFGDILKRYTDIVGKPILPEKWLFGHIQHHCCTWTADDVMEVARKYREGDWPCDVLIMDHQALGKGLNWDKGYENYKQMYDYIDKLGFKTCFSCALFDDIYNWKKYDPTVEEDVRKYWTMYVPRVKDGMDFWREDNSERSTNYTNLEYFANGYKAHELFGSLWAKNVVEGMESMGLYGRPVISRGGPIGGHRYIIPWPGDTPHGLQFLDIDLNFVRNGGLAGYSSIAVDLGGFIDRGKGKPLEEQNVIRRVINMLPVIPISKLQGAGDESAKLPWLLTPKQQELERYYLKLRYRLLPYRYSGAIEAHLTGRPILAPLVFDYQDDVNTFNTDFEFMLGRELLVAPVMKKTEKWNVYLPRGKWIHYWTGKKYQGGGTVTVDAPLYGQDGLPMFVKAGAIIPMMPEMSYIYEKTPDPITLDIYPDQDRSSSYVMYDCDSVKTPVQVKQTTFVCTEQTKEIEITISPSDVAYELWVHHSDRPVSVLDNGRKLPEVKDRTNYDTASVGWYYGAGCFYGSNKLETINIKIPKVSGQHIVKIKLPESGRSRVTVPTDNAERAVEKQITFEPRNHYLGNLYNFSPDDKWLAYDTRTSPPAIGSNQNIEKVNLQTGKVVVLYETPHQSQYGPGCGSADYHPLEDKVIFIHGLMNCDANRPYWFTRRTGVAVDSSEPGKPIFMDARDVTPPFTPGALRGGTHAHQWSADGKWIAFTYNDAIMADIEKRTGKKADLRTVGVATDLRPVTVDKDPEGENNDGIWFSALVVKVVPNPRPGSDEISRAFSDSWVGTRGYQKPDGNWQRAEAFLGKTRDKNGQELVEVYIVDIPDRIDVPGDAGPLEGTTTTFPMPPKGTQQRRLTHTENWKYPGVVTNPRHWVRSSPDGSRISFLARDDNGIVQVFFVSPLGGEPVQVTHHRQPIQSSLNWSPDGTAICYVCDNSVWVCDVGAGSSFGKTHRVTLRTDNPPLFPVWSHNGKIIAFNKMVPNGRKSYLQVFILKL